MGLGKTLATPGLPGRTVLLILFWQAFVFLGTLVPFSVQAEVVPPAAVLGFLAAVAALLGMYQAFDWDKPPGRTALEQLRRSSWAVRVIYGPVVLGGWLLENLFFGSVLTLTILLIWPLLVAGYLRSLAREHRWLRGLRKQGRLMPWSRVPAAVERGDGFLLLELQWEEAGPSWAKLSRLWWVPCAAEQAPLKERLPTYRQFLENNMPADQTNRPGMQQAFQDYQHPQHGRGLLVTIPPLARRRVKKLLAEPWLAATLRVTWFNT
jgi:hypothetical protein